MELKKKKQTKKNLRCRENPIFFFVFFVGCLPNKDKKASTHKDKREKRRRRRRRRRRRKKEPHRHV